MSVVSVRPVAIAAQLAQFILSGGYLETPSEYLDETEIQDYLDELAVNAASIEDDASERAINDVLSAYGLEKKLGIICACSITHHTHTLFSRHYCKCGGIRLGNTDGQLVADVWATPCCVRGFGWKQGHVHCWS